MSTENQPSSTNRIIESSDFKSKCLELMDEVAETGEEIVITKNGKAIAKLTPYREAPDFIFGRYRDKIVIHGDIVSPMPPEWFAVPEEYANMDPLIAPLAPDWTSEPTESPETLS